MSTDANEKKIWEAYCESELARIKPILETHGFMLNDAQPHLSGERYLMQAITTASGKKLILLGTHSTGAHVVIKATRDTGGIDELVHERMCREILHRIDFAGEVFHTPEEIAFIRENGYTISIQRFVEQKCSFLERPLEEQFSFALRAFKGQESAHATTFKHRKLISSAFGIRDSHTYINTFNTFLQNVKNTFPSAHAVHSLLADANKILRENAKIIEQYSGFLTHTDFVPHNIRIADNTIFLLDQSSFTFGNKYEGWARFLNFMALYNPPLQKALEQYVRDNRAPEELVSLRMMRIYRLGEIIWYYVQTLDKSSDNLLTLNTARINFWKDVLLYVLKNVEVPQSVITEYTQTRDSLRSGDEKKRQQGLH